MVSRMFRGVVWILVVIVVGPLLVGAIQVLRVDVWATLTPISTSGGCNKRDVAVYLRERPSFAVWQYVNAETSDIEQLRHLQERLQKTHVPPCLEGLRNEELQLMEDIMRGIEFYYHREGVLARLYGIWKLTGIATHIERVHAASASLVERYDLREEDLVEPPGRG